MKEAQVQEALVRLRGDAQAMPWMRRRDLARSLGDAFRAGQAAESAPALVLLLAQDPKWEVRKQVADVLPHLPEASQIPIIAKLAHDDSFFVRNAVERMADAKRKAISETQRQRRTLETAKASLAALSISHGAPAARKAARIVDRLYGTMAGATSHELLGKLTSLKADLLALRSKAKDRDMQAEEFERLLGKAVGQVDFLERFVSAMKAHAKHLPEERRPEPLYDVLAEAQTEALQKLKAAGYDPGAVAGELKVSRKLSVEMARVPLVVAFSDLIKNAYERAVQKVCRELEEVV